MKSVQVGIRMDTGLLSQVDEQAKIQKRTRADMIRIMADYWLEHEAVRVDSTKSLGGLRGHKEAV